MYLDCTPQVSLKSYNLDCIDVEYGDRGAYRALEMYLIEEGLSRLQEGWIRREHVPNFCRTVCCTRTHSPDLGQTTMMVGLLRAVGTFH